MQAIEFQTRIENGAILIPEEYKSQLTGPVRVIVMTEDRSVDSSMIQELLANPLKVPDFKPLTREEIYGRD